MLFSKEPLYAGRGISGPQPFTRQAVKHRLFLLMTVCLICFTPLCQAQASASRLDKVVKPYVVGRHFMGAVLVARHGTVLLNKGYGYANLEWQIRNDPQVRFRLASITKQFTAACILLLAEEGKVNLSDHINKYIPQVPASWNGITIFNLLTHTSGIPNFTEFPDYNSFETQNMTPQRMIERLQNMPLEFRPGTSWKYSNSGYIVLGYVIEKLSGQSYGKFVQEHIFDPLRMRQSGYDSNSTIISQMASGYQIGVRGFLNASYIDMSVPFAAGGLYSTTGDLLRWEEGLFGGRLLSSASVKQMTTPFMNHYAFGLHVQSVHGHLRIDHDGDINGFGNELAYYPDDRVSVVVLGNVEGASSVQIATELAATLLNEDGQ